MRDAVPFLVSATLLVIACGHDHVQTFTVSSDGDFEDHAAPERTNVRVPHTGNTETGHRMKSVVRSVLADGKVHDQHHTQVVRKVTAGGDNALSPNGRVPKYSQGYRPSVVRKVTTARDAISSEEKVKSSETSRQDSGSTLRHQPRHASVVRKVPSPILGISTAKHYQTLGTNKVIHKTLFALILFAGGIATGMALAGMNHGWSIHTLAGFRGTVDTPRLALDGNAMSSERVFVTDTARRSRSNERPDRLPRASRASKLSTVSGADSGSESPTGFGPSRSSLSVRAPPETINSTGPGDSIEGLDQSYDLSPPPRRAASKGFLTPHLGISPRTSISPEDRAPRRARRSRSDM